MNKRAFVALALALLSVSCTSGGPSPLLKENESLARILMKDFESGDVSNLGGMFYPTAVYDDYSSQNEYQGLREISGYVQSLQTWANSISVDVTAVHPSETGATVEWTLNAVQERPIPGRINVATGNQVQVNGVTVIEVSNHLITRAADYVDDLGMMLQLGGTLTMPGGTVLKLGNVPAPDSTVGGG